ncbi:MAG TPA: hypothetical protein VN654_14325 [Vicinamibacterales bacterium]|nr:hypothetical protein [Vicinamibacterales bacterium]
MARARDGFSSREAEPTMLLREDAHARVGESTPNQIDASVGRSVVHDDELEVRPVLRERRGDRLLYAMRGVVQTDGNDHGRRGGKHGFQMK